MYKPSLDASLNDKKETLNTTYTSLKQAKVLYAFSRESGNEQAKYLKLNKGDYMLVTGNLDENWVIGEDFKGEKGIYPANYIEYIEGYKKLMQNFAITIRKFYQNIIYFR